MGSTGRVLRSEKFSSFQRLPAAHFSGHVAQMTASAAPSIAIQVEAAQSILQGPGAVAAKRLELAHAAASGAFVRAMAKLRPNSGASSLEIMGGLAIQAGMGSPLTQGLAMGLNGPVTEADLDAMEAHLCPGGLAYRQLELCPYADPSLPNLLARRGYRVHEWQLIWERPVPTEPVPGSAAGLTVRRILPREEEIFFRAVMAGFLESEEVSEEAIAMMQPSAHAEHHELYLALLGDEPIGGATFATHQGVALINGSGVRPQFRNRGAQGSLIRARLNRARELGCDVATSATLPGTSSRRNMERHGFHVAYPKLVMAKD
jgi:GNAT superfamily N-acetyltransferase